NPYFSDFPAIDNRGKRQRLVLRISEDRKQAFVSQNRPVFQSLWMNHEDFGQSHRRFHTQWSKPHIVGLHQLIGHRKGYIPQLIDTNRNGLSLTPKDIGQLLLRLNQLSQTLLGHPIPYGSTGGH